MTVLYSIVAFAILFGIIVLVHEFGHFVAARLTGVRVEAFSFGFGKRIWGKKVGDTDFRISLVPLGGYVKMAGEEEWDPDNLKPDEFYAKNRAQKIFILIMGPLMNLLLAFLIYTVLNMVGVKVPQYKYEKPVIGYVEKNSTAEAAGITKGDKIVSINGKTIENWKELELFIGSNPSENLHITIERQGEILEKTLEVQSISHYNLGEAGLEYGYQTQIQEVEKDYPAAAVGIKKEDFIVAIDGQPMVYDEAIEKIAANAGNPLKLTIKTGKTDKEVEITPRRFYYLESYPVETIKAANQVYKQLDKALKDLDFKISPRDGQFTVVSRYFDTLEEANRYRPAAPVTMRVNNKGVIGAQLLRYSPPITDRYGFFEAMKKSVTDIKDKTFLVFTALRKLIVGKISPTSLSGPLEIATFSGKAMESGPTNFFMLIAFISLQLGLINLLPIPALDGGHLLIFSIEAIIRKDFSPKVKIALMNVGFILLITLMAFVVLNDITKQLPNGWYSLLPF